MILTLLLLAASGGSLQNLDALDQQIIEFTGADVGEEGGALQHVDRRLKLRACSAPADISWRTDDQNTLVVKCPDAGGWRLYMPVNAALKPMAAGSDTGAVVVQRGDAVSIAVAGQGFSVSRPGEAMEEGAIGDWIKVRPVSDTRRRPEIIRARIIKPGVVALPTS